MPPTPTDKQAEELKEFLNLVIVEGSDVVNEWELGFTEDLLKRADRLRISPNQREALFLIKKKMIKEGLCEEDDYAQI